jgi:ATP-binding cassette subfamily B protein
VVKDLRIAVYEKIVGLNLRQFDTTPIGTLTTRTIDDIERINDIFSDGLIPIIADLLTIIFTLATMFWMIWQLTLVSLAPFPIMIIATYFFKESVNKSFVEVRNAVASLNAFIQEHLSGMAVVQAFAAEGRELNKFKKINAEHRLANIKAIFAYSVFFPIVEVVLAISTGLLVWFIAGNALDAGLLMSFILYLNQLFRPLRVIADKFNVLQMGMVAAERVFKVMDNPDQMPPDSADSIDAGVLNGHIDFKEVWFAYKEDQYVLRGINFSIRAGQTVALVGHTGSGKTSIISLLNRLYTINKGSLLLDQKPVTAYTLESLRRNIGVVLQDVFLFSGSILDNITLRNPAILEADVIKAAKLMGLHDFIMQLPGGYHYHVMERGATLSLGQRQLISFIRALLYNPSVLVLDEATSSVDSETEQLIEKATETGFDEITFIESENSERTKVNLERCEKIAVSAMKQSKQCYLPKINALQKFTDVIKQDLPGDKFMAWCEADDTVLINQKINQLTSNHITILIGPEGDFTKAEVKLAQQHHFIPVSLGKTILRTETAALYACFTVKAILTM